MDDPLLTNTNSAKNKSRYQKSTNFIEAIREQSGAVTKGVVNGFVDQISGKNSQDTQTTNPQNPNQQPFNFAEYLKLRENKIRQQERMLHQQQQRSESVLFYKKEEDAKKEIEFIKAEIKKIIVTSQNVSVELIEAEKTVMTNTVEAGTYQLNFFQKIRTLIILAKKRLSEAQNWLDLFNSRSKQKAFYWGQVKKSGTKFMLSQERQLATQSG